MIEPRESVECPMQMLPYNLVSCFNNVAAMVIAIHSTSIISIIQHIYRRENQFFCESGQWVLVLVQKN